MATRVDPAQYTDTPIFQALLEERKGRWPGIPEGEVYDSQTMERMVSSLEELAAQDPPVMQRVTPGLPDYVRVQPDPEETVQMPILPIVID